MTATAAPAPGSDDAGRLALAVGRRTGTAVDRNRVRRRLRAAWAELGPPAGYDVVLGAGPEAGGVSFQELVNHLRTALARAGVAGMGR